MISVCPSLIGVSFSSARSLNNIFSSLRLLIHLLLKGWSCFGKSTGSCFDDETSPVGLDSEFGGVSNISILSGLTSNTDNSRVNGGGDTVIFLLVDFGQIECLLL